MAYVAVNGFDTEHASSLIVVENLMYEIQHINGKGVTDKYTKTDSVRDVTQIDVMRVLPFAPEFRQLGAANNGAYHNSLNNGYDNAPASTHYSIPIDLYYDRGVPITSVQDAVNKIPLQSIIMAQIVKTAGLTINVVTYAKQFEAYFKDSFSTAPTEDEIATSIFAGTKSNDADADGSYADAFIAANAQLTDGVVELGALNIPLEERQAFVTPTFNRIVKRQYMQNASEAAARILANGFINPFTDSEGQRINSATGLCGQYDGVDLVLYNSVTSKFVKQVLGLANNTSSDNTNASKGKLYKAIVTTIVEGSYTVAVNHATYAAKVSRTTAETTFTYDGTNWKVSGSNVTLADYGITVTGTASSTNSFKVSFNAKGYVGELLDRIQAMIVYGGGTCRGIVGPTVAANFNTYYGGVYVLPQMKLGVQVLNGKSIKCVSDGTMVADDIALVASTVSFTALDGVVNSAAKLIDGFNDGSVS